MPDGFEEELGQAMEALQDRYRAVELDGRTVRLDNPVNGDAGIAVLRALGIAQTASPVGAAAHGPNIVAIGVWRAPDLYLARWTQNRWIVGYRLPRGSKPSDYIGSEGRIPSRLETGNWYAVVPDGVTEAFDEVGISLEEPPFPPPPPAPPPERKTRSRPPAAGRPATPRTVARRPPAEPKPEPGPTDRICPSCNMRKSLTQFTAGSDLCVDCR